MMSFSQSMFTGFLWLNGDFLSVRDAAISPFDRGFLYGDGFFETLRAENGQVLYWPEHRERLYRSAAAFRINLDLSLDWCGIFQDLLYRNGLVEKVARIKIIVTRGVSQELGLPASNYPTLCVLVQEYLSPDENVYRRGWRIHVFQEGFAPPLARYKSLNYLYFLMARQTALDAGADEALILGPRGNVAETATGSILAKAEGKWWVPVSNYQLPGITLRQVVHLIYESNQEVKFRPTSLENLYSAETIWVLNSLMGIMPVSHLNGHPLKNMAAEEAAHFREAYFKQGSPHKMKVDTETENW